MPSKTVRKIGIGRLYLAVTRQPQSRLLLADLLWENTPEPQSKTNLRYLLSNLRKVVGDYVVAQGETVAFNQELPHWLDVSVFTTYFQALQNLQRAFLLQQTSVEIKLPALLLAYLAEHGL